MGNKNTTWLINNTDEVMEIRQFRGLILDKNNFINKKTVKAHERINIDSKNYDGHDCRGGQPSCLMIFCGGSLLNLRSSEEYLLLPGDKFINFETVTIDKSEDQNSTGVVNYEVKFQPRDASFTVKSLKVPFGSLH
ncbi:hypothetical protein RHSIM_Rhsim02G0192300 [Rhododendron simsii]|uniref:Uncharacterized protein n=1 Tax=Rhododendron simsii TaxID=118357 RepID=A0A834HD14_RHOSS|nr:hypothetical protein RHSIM_Rhsim02G0192300 [Rhododendron simsii]